MNAPRFFSRFAWTAVVVGFVAAALPCHGADELTYSNTVPAITNSAETTTNSVALVEAAAVSAVTNTPVENVITPQLIEQIRREIELSSARNAAAMAASLNFIEPTLTRLQQQQAESLQKANNRLLLMACIFAGLSFVVLVVIILILARTLGRFSDLAVTAAPVRRELRAGAVAGALEAGTPPGPDAAVENASNRFQGALEQLQRRILELEHGLQASTNEASRNEIASGLQAAVSPSNGSAHAAITPNSFQPLPHPSERTSTAQEGGEPASRASVLLGKGQTLFNLGEWKEALACFEQVLALTPQNAEAQVKRGLALEQLEKWSEALESYNRALEIDSTLTVAYLYKGAVCNRLQRYEEALASYESALHPERKIRAS